MVVGRRYGLLDLGEVLEHVVPFQVRTLCDSSEVIVVGPRPTVPDHVV